ncbi:MAG TPA: tRNA glutamyl-Q(34) synthetase GluQRS [Polyangiaceae bacterium]|nr:tRNA glutamyl-Q(34) synthetase GluQRS [Polyangiaceae bacterium]
MNEPALPVGRLAPSPSGRLHLGHARTFVLAWVDARQRGGGMRLRLEDLDRSRCRPEHIRRSLLDLEWLGLDWDGEPLYQSQRLDALREAADRLERTGAAYRCVCTRADLEQAAQAPQRGVTELRYPGTCRSRVLSPGSSEASSALRLRVPEGQLSFVDGIAGPQSVDVASEVGDFVILSRSRLPAYQLAVVVDDAEQGVNEVFRGDDLLSSTARQLLVARALGLPEPRWCHVPLVLDAGGRRLAKRADDLSLETIREAGVDVRALIAWVGRSAGFDVPDRLTARELCTRYDRTQLSQAPVILSDAEIAALMTSR